VWHFINDNYENSHCSPEQVEEYLAGNCSDGNVCALLKLMPMQEMYCSQDKQTDVSKDSLSGMTLEHSMETHGKEKLMLSQEDSLAKIYPQQEKELESQENDLDYGRRWRELSVKYDRATSSWKTHRCLWEEDLDWFSLTLPKWGMMRRGVLLERITPVLHTSEIESGLWRTPTAHDWKNTGCCNQIYLSDQVRPEQVTNKLKKLSMMTFATPQVRDSQPEGLEAGKRRMERYSTCGLQTAVHLWPTPQAHKTTESGEIVNADGTPWDGKSKPHSKTTGRPITTALADAVRFATPQERDFRTGSTDRWDNPARSRNLNDQIGGQLNPTWVEWLMGWPLGWTDCAASATAKFQEWLSSHGKY
jgi:hypothetical protein